MEKGDRSATGWRLLLPYAAALAATGAFQVGAALAKSLFSAIGAEGTATLRLGLGSLMLLALTRPWRRWPSGAPVLPLLGLGCCMAGVILMFYMALSRLPLGIAIALQALGPLTLATVLSRRPPDLMWAALAAVGVWSLVGQRTAAPLDPIGVGWALGAAAGWAAYILLGRSASRTFGRSTPALSVTLATILILPVGVEHAGWLLFAPALIPLALVIALFSTAIPFSLELYALPRMPARSFAVFTSLEPAFGALFGFLILHERLAASQLLGIVAVVAAAAGSACTSVAEASEKPNPLAPS